MGRVRSPEKNAIPWANSARSKSMAPEKSIGREFRVCQLLPTVPALFDDSSVATDLRKLVEEGEKVGAGHGLGALHAERVHHTLETTGKVVCHSGDQGARRVPPKHLSLHRN